MAESSFSADEIRQHVRETANRRRNVDYDRLKLMNELKTLVLRGSEEEFEAKLHEAGIAKGSPQWHAAKRLPAESR